MGLRLSPEQRSKLDVLATAAGKSSSRVIRDLIAKAYKEAFGDARPTAKVSPMGLEGDVAEVEVEAASVPVPVRIESPPITCQGEPRSPSTAASLTPRQTKTNFSIKMTAEEEARYASMSTDEILHSAGLGDLPVTDRASEVETEKVVDRVGATP